MEVLSSYDLKKGKKAEMNRMGGTLTMPVQFLPLKDKTPQWYAETMDWLEFQGLKQIRRNAKRLIKNYKLAKGLIERSDYIASENQEEGDLINNLMKDDNAALELKFYPIVPTVINTLVAEFAKRNTRVSFRAVDELSYNEILAQKREDVEKVLLAEAEQKIKLKLTIPTPVRKSHIFRQFSHP